MSNEKKKIQKLQNWKVYYLKRYYSVFCKKRKVKISKIKPKIFAISRKRGHLLQERTWPPYFKKYPKTTILPGPFTKLLLIFFMFWSLGTCPHQYAASICRMKKKNIKILTKNLTPFYPQKKISSYLQEVHRSEKVP